MLLSESPFVYLRPPTELFKSFVPRLADGVVFSFRCGVALNEVGGGKNEL